MRDDDLVEHCRRCFSEEIYPATNRMRVFAATLLASMLFPLGLGAVGMFVEVPRPVIGGMVLVVALAPFVAVFVSSLTTRKRCRNCGLEWR